MSHLKLWHLLLAALCFLVLMSAVFSAWGFIAAWLGLGIIAFAAYMLTGGEPGNFAPIASCAGLILSGPFGFWVIFNEVLSLRKAQLGGK